MRMSELLNEVRNFSLDEGFSPKEIKMAIGIASDPRYAKGNMTGAVTAIERMKKGLSKHPQVMAVLKRQNEDFDEGYKPVKSNHFDVKIQGVKKKDVEAILKYIKQDGGNYDIEDVDDDQVRGGGSSGTSDGDIFIQGDDAGKLGMEIAKKFRGVKVMGEAVSPAQQAAIAISKKERGEKPKEEGNTFGKELKAARDKGEKTFVVSGKKYNVEDLDTKDEPKVKEIIKKLKGASQAHAGQAKDLEKAVTEKFSDGMIDKLRKAYEPLRGKKIPPGPLMKIFDKIDSNKAGLEQLYKADIPFVSVMAMSRLMLRHNYKATDINKLGKINMEEFELDEAKGKPNDKLEINIPYGMTSDEKNGLDFAKFRIMQYSEPNSRGIQVNKWIGTRKNLQRMILDVMSKARAKKVFQFSGPPEARLFEEVELDEEISINELKMNDPKLIKVFDKLKAKDTVKIKSSSTISQGKDFIEYQVKTKNTLRNGVEKITLMLKGNPTGKNRFLYKKDGKVTFAIGDLGASIDDIKEMAYKPGSFKDTRPQEKTAKAFDKYIKTGGLDQEDFEKARKLYVQTSDVSSRKKLRNFIQDLDTAPMETVMDIIGRNDPDTFEKMYPDAKSGEFLSKISFRHRKIKNEEVELGEKYDLYHKDFSSAMQHAYSYAKQKMGITIDPKEIDSKVATGPKKPTEGKTNKYRLKGKGGNLQIQVYNKGGSKPFELNMYKEGADPSVSLYADQITLNAIKEK